MILRKNIMIIDDDAYIGDILEEAIPTSFGSSSSPLRPGSISSRSISSSR